MLNCCGGIVHCVCLVYALCWFVVYAHCSGQYSRKESFVIVWAHGKSVKQNRLVLCGLCSPAIKVESRRASLLLVLFFIPTLRRLFSNKFRFRCYFRYYRLFCCLGVLKLFTVFCVLWAENGKNYDGLFVWCFDTISCCLGFDTIFLFNVLRYMNVLKKIFCFMWFKFAKLKIKVQKYISLKFHRDIFSK